jgi:hypothetical protein
MIGRAAAVARLDEMTHRYGGTVALDAVTNPVGMCGADFVVYLRKQYDEYGQIIREANIKALGIP